LASADKISAAEGKHMRIGVFYFPADYGINIVELARALEERGFESLFVPEHTHIPVSRKSPFPSGGELPKRYAHTHDPFVALSFAAAATRKLLVGTGICLIPERDPIVTAKCVASLDQLSGAASCSASAAAGTSRKWKTTAPATTPASS
jgi:alkanesulfonate monooxygenase SsuD/methylene tetrahydromethanopterin reductase-like flavin-dependent oxidoreductase (luciferase family)